MAGRLGIRTLDVVRRVSVKLHIPTSGAYPGGDIGFLLLLKNQGVGFPKCHDGHLVLHVGVSTVDDLSINDDI